MINTKKNVPSASDEKKLSIHVYESSNRTYHTSPLSFLATIFSERGHSVVFHGAEWFARSGLEVFNDKESGVPDIALYSNGRTQFFNPAYLRAKGSTCVQIYDELWQSPQFSAFTNLVFTDPYLLKLLAFANPPFFPAISRALRFFPQHMGAIDPKLWDELDKGRYSEFRYNGGLRGEGGNYLSLWMNHRQEFCHTLLRLWKRRPSNYPRFEIPTISELKWPIWGENLKGSDISLHFSDVCGQVWGVGQGLYEAIVCEVPVVEVNAQSLNWPIVQKLADLGVVACANTPREALTCAEVLVDVMSKQNKIDARELVIKERHYRRVWGPIVDEILQYHKKEHEW